MAAAHDIITEVAFPFTREGPRNLLAKASALRRANKHAWSMFFEQMEAVQELRANLEDVREPLRCLANAVPAVVGAESKPRPKRDADDLQTPKDEQPVPEGAYITRYKGDCYVCDASWTAGATVAKHRRLQNKQVVCTGCANAVVPCTICGSERSLLGRGSQPLPRNIAEAEERDLLVCR